MQEHLPIFSVIVPAYEGSGRLASCLQSLARLKYPRERFQVMVVDDGSERTSETLINGFRNRLDVVLLMQGHTGPPRARATPALRVRKASCWPSLMLIASLPPSGYKLLHYALAKHGIA